MREGLESFVRWVMRDATYHRVYAAKVVLQREDGRVDLDPEDEPMRGQGLQAVPISVSVPGTLVKLEPQSRCLFGFEDGDPRKPRIIAWPFEKNASRVALAGGEAQLGRVGDIGDVLLDPVTTVEAIIEGVATPPLPATPVVVPSSIFLGTVTFTDPTPPVVVWQTGNPKLLA